MSLFVSCVRLRLSVVCSVLFRLSSFGFAFFGFCVPRLSLPLLPLFVSNHRTTAFFVRCFASFRPPFVLVSCGSFFRLFVSFLRSPSPCSRCLPLRLYLALFLSFAPLRAMLVALCLASAPSCFAVHGCVLLSPPYGSFFVCLMQGRSRKKTPSLGGVTLFRFSVVCCAHTSFACVMSPVCDLPLPPVGPLLIQNGGTLSFLLGVSDYALQLKGLVFLIFPGCFVRFWGFLPLC